jgi:hypothetical protein
MLLKDESKLTEGKAQDAKESDDPSHIARTRLGERRADMRALQPSQSIAPPLALFRPPNTRSRRTGSHIYLSTAQALPLPPCSTISLR